MTKGNELVSNILFDYTVPPNIDSKDVYQFLVDNDITNVYKRKESSGQYSEFVCETFWYPTDSTLDDDIESSESISDEKCE